MHHAQTHNMTQAIGDAQEIAALVHRCTESDTPIIDYGVAHGGLGFPPPEDHIVLQQSGGIIEHYVRDLTVRVAAGATIGELQNELRETGQFLPVDADDDMTIGEVINHFVHGPMRAKYGSIRDLILGLRYVDGRGRDIHVGGRTVKNVAGYDVTRMLCGSLGELGIVYEATIRTYAVPEMVMSVTVDGVDGELFCKLVTDMILTDAAPAGMAMSRAGSDWRLHIDYHGSVKSCGIQRDALKRFLGEHLSRANVTNVTDHTLMDAAAGTTKARAWRRGGQPLIKVITPPAEIIDGVSQVIAAANVNESEPVEVFPMHGGAFVGMPETLSDIAEADTAIIDAVSKHGGQRIWYRQPDAATLDPVAPLPDDFPLMLRLKQTMDPHNLFNRGRWLRMDKSET